MYGSASGTQPVLEPPTGPIWAIGRDPARGFPPRGAQQDHAADSWYTPASGYAPADGYTPAGTHAPAGGYPPAESYLSPVTRGYTPPAADPYQPPKPPPVPDSYPPAPVQDSYPPPPAKDAYATQAQDAYPPPGDGGFALGYTDEERDYPDDPDRGYAFLDDEPEDEAPRRGWFRRPAVLGVVAVVLLAALGAVGYRLVYEPRSATARAENALKLPTTDPTAGNPYFSKKLGQFQHIASRKLDPVPLKLSELYPPAFTLKGSEYVKTTATLTKTCGDAVIGDLIQAALQEGDCSQVARADYVSSDDKIMGTIGVVNLTSAHSAGKAAKTASATELIAPLTTSKGPTKKLLTGTGLAYAEIKGHYLILLYAEFANTKTPSSAAQKQELVAFCDGMFAGSADISLSHRMLYGKP